MSKVPIQHRQYRYHHCDKDLMHNHPHLKKTKGRKSSLPTDLCENLKTVSRILVKTLVTLSANNGIPMHSRSTKFRTMVTQTFKCHRFRLTGLSKIRVIKKTNLFIRLITTDADNQFGQVQRKANVTEN